MRTDLNGRRSPVLLLVWTAAVLDAGSSLSAQALTGTTGLVMIPTAEMPADGTVAVGVNLIARQYHDYVEPHPEYTAMVQFASIGFLPFAEVGLRLTRLVDLPEPQALGDRMVSVRLRLLTEGPLAPAVVVGGHDLLGTRIFHAFYVVGSKHADSVPVLGSASVHLGYGVHTDHLPSMGRQFPGVFGGISIAPRPWVALLVEHDAKRVNAGVRLRSVRGVVLLASLQGMQGLSGGISYTHRLH
jgi:hypothetical protein